MAHRFLPRLPRTIHTPIRTASPRPHHCRHYSSPQSARSQAALSSLRIQKTQSPSPPPDAGQLQFGRAFTDHIFTFEWTTEHGWTNPQITPYGKMPLDPAACVLHYAFTCFEGMKAYKDPQGNARLFRPQKNLQRLNRSAARLALPTFDEESMLDLLARYVELEKGFIPPLPGYSLYLRPTLMGTEASISVSRPRSALLYVIASPMGNYFAGGMKAVSLQATRSPVRAWPGGVGEFKVGGNYAPSIVPQEDAAAAGFQQNLWLLADSEGDEYVTEAGTMNLFVVWVNPDTGRTELVTPPLDGTILPGVTRTSILELARERLSKEGMDISERSITMKELANASREGRLSEVFGAGTAVVVSPVRSIQWNDQTIDCGLKKDEEAGPVSLKVKKWIEEIQYGLVDHPWSYRV
ncbi:putative branched-chain amino acid aminotransferase [Aspergillus homomorphus CBS 101889]|uniref:Branched-chain-amino-acid aminotransferase n=1 Tax=Aspergillus homomorphus (strain CBS 101889) TaxID=1450537 RepID=A0A395HHG9_ASPHC|nr:putative branched-chain amino acid aminotransferase [Aspergillus homomorphus CBS 101889]RAL06939.1 putative branched-chain amino acid aminotransferase [Aspergillus homomorphus CBS 101889]